MTFAFTRDPNGNILTSAREDGSCWYYAYDGMQRLTGAEWKDGATLLYGYQYNYDKVGNRMSMIINGETACCYSYNACNELTDELSGSEEVDYEYDGRGNCIRKTVEGGATTYFDYNARNLITRIDSTEPGFTPNLFTYNALGQRISKTDSTGTTYYVWDGLNILLEHDGAGTITRRYTYGHEAIHGVAGLIDVEDVSGGSHYFYHFDQVGGVRALTDQSAATDTTYEYSPFGRILAETAGSAPNDFAFPGTYLKLPDAPELRLSPTRCYDANAGRFGQRDREEQLPTYAYGGGNPGRSVDPGGSSWWFKPPPVPPGRYPLPDEPPLEPGRPPVERIYDTGIRPHKIDGVRTDPHVHRWETHKGPQGDVNTKDLGASHPTTAERLEVIRQTVGDRLMHPNYCSFRYMGRGTLAQGAVVGAVVAVGAVIIYYEVTTTLKFESEARTGTARLNEWDSVTAHWARKGEVAADRLHGQLGTDELCPTGVKENGEQELRKCKESFRNRMHYAYGRAGVNAFERYQSGEISHRNYPEAARVLRAPAVARALKQFGECVRARVCCPMC